MIRLAYSCAMEASLQVSLGRVAIRLPPKWTKRDLRSQDRVLLETALGALEYRSKSRTVYRAGFLSV